jgi:probable rRNA maturation factor
MPPPDSEPLPSAAPSEREVFVSDEQSQFDIDLRRYAALARAVLTAERVRIDAELSMTFVDEPTMADLHERFLGFEGPTDVLAFPMDEEIVEPGRQPDQGGRGPGAPPEPSDAPVMVGDVVLCPAVAARQAGEHGHPLEAELDLLVVHGVLHLLDYDHEDDDEAAEMRRREQQILESFRGAWSR